ncbi:MAG: alpha-isopropylmalate synthase regulatory domain-containing protein, partial [Roseiarcus sp.]
LERRSHRRLLHGRQTSRIVSNGTLEFQRNGDGRLIHGVGIDPSIVMASLKAALNAAQRLMVKGA